MQWVIGLRWLMNIGDLVRHTNIPAFGAGLVTGRKEGSAGVYIRWLDPKRATCVTSMEVALVMDFCSGVLKFK